MVSRFHFLDRGEEAVGGVEFDLFDCGAGFGGGVLLQVLGGDLKAVEEQAGAARVDVMGGDAVEDFAEGELDGAAVFGVGKLEYLLMECAAAAFPVWEGLAGFLVEVAEIVTAKAGAAATVAIGEDVAALEAVVGVGLAAEVGLCHGWSPSPLFGVKLR